MSRLLVVAGMVVAAAGPLAAVATDEARPDASRRAAAYLATTQGGDGTLPAGAPPNATAEALVALVAGGGQPAAVASALGHLGDRGRAEIDAAPSGKKAAYAGRIVSGLVAAGRDPRAFAGTDFVALLQSFYNPVTGGYGGENLYGDTLAMLGVLAAGAPLADASVTRLTLSQCDDGGWSYQVGCVGVPDTDTTSMAVSVLAAKVGVHAPEVSDGRGWLLATQNSTGGWGFEDANADAANSTGLALSAVAALGEQPSGSPWTSGTRRPVDALLGLQLDSGAFRRDAAHPAPNTYATVQATPGLAGWSYPVRAPSPAGATPTTRPAGAAAGGGTGSGPVAAPEPAGRTQRGSHGEPGDVAAGAPSSGGSTPAATADRAAPGSLAPGALLAGTVEPRPVERKARPSLAPARNAGRAGGPGAGRIPGGLTAVAAGLWLAVSGAWVRERWTGARA